MEADRPRGALGSHELFVEGRGHSSVFWSSTLRENEGHPRERLCSGE